MGFGPRVLLIHDNEGQLKLNSDEAKAFEKIVRQLPKRRGDFSNYRTRLVKNGSAPFKCRAGSRYLNIDEYGKVKGGSRTRKAWPKALRDYTFADLRGQSIHDKSC